MSWDLITSVCLVADRKNVPSGHEVIATTTDNTDADLWKDKRFRKPVFRYLCFSRERNHQIGDLVLADVTVLKEGDKVPPGYTCILNTIDSNEPCLKKKNFVVRMIKRSETNQAITDIYLTSGKSKNVKPVESTMRTWDISGLTLYLRFGPVVQYPALGSVPAASALPYQFPQRTLSQEAQPAVPGMPPSSVAPVTIPRHPDLHRQTTLRSPGSPEHQLHINAIDGVPFDLNPILRMTSHPEQMSIPLISYLSPEDINQKYDYDFSTEHTVKQQATLS